MPQSAKLQSRSCTAVEFRSKYRMCLWEKSGVERVFYFAAVADTSNFVRYYVCG